MTVNAYNATRAASTVQPIYHHGGAIGVYSTFALTGTAFGSGDTVTLCTVPKFAVILDTILAADQLDTNATPTIKYSIGDSGSSTRFINATAQGTTIALAPVHMGVAAGLGYQYTTNGILIMTVAAAPATGTTSGNIYFSVLYSMDAITATIEGQETP